MKKTIKKIKDFIKGEDNEALINYYMQRGLTKEQAIELIEKNKATTKKN